MLGPRATWVGPAGPPWMKRPKYSETPGATSRDAPGVWAFGPGWVSPGSERVQTNTCVNPLGGESMAAPKKVTPKKKGRDAKAPAAAGDKTSMAGEKMYPRPAMKKVARKGKRPGAKK